MLTTVPQKPRAARPGFTLVEILVVIAIISILTALIAAGVVAVIGSQRQSSTENTMRAVYKVLSRQMKYVLDKADKEVIPQSVITMANGDAKLARVIWKKLRLKQEFPMTFAEAQFPSYPASYAFVPSPTPPTSAPPISINDLPALPVYTKALQNLGPINWQGQPFLESSVCLLLALQQSRGGVSLTPDQLGSAAVALQVKNNPGLNISGLKMLVDNWGVEIAFFRFPTSNDDATIPLNNDLDKQNPANGTSTTAATYKDPYDPQGLLMNPSWNSATNWNANSGVYWFEQYCHLVHSPNASAYPTVPGSYSQLSTYMLPTLVSAGRDGKWGLNSSRAFTLTPPSSPPYPTPFNPLGPYPPYNGFYDTGANRVGPGANPDMSIDPANVGDSNDNIYSYRLGLDSRGD